MPSILRIAIELCAMAIAGHATPTARIVVDRIEGATAVLELAPHHFIDVPAELLPEGAGEGCVLELSIKKREEETWRASAAAP